MGLMAWLSLMYVPSRLFVHGDATATAHNIRAAESLYRLGILSQLASQTLFVVLALVLYDLFRDVDRRQARLMVALVLVSVAVEMANCLNLIAPLILLGGADFLSVFSPAQLDALAFAFLRLRNSGVNLVSLLWGLWLLPFGILVIRSRFAPTLLGILLILSCVAYVAESVTSILWPVRMDVVSAVTLPVGGLGELLIVGWFLIKGVGETAVERRST